MRRQAFDRTRSIDVREVQIVATSIRVEIGIADREHHALTIGAHDRLAMSWIVRPFGAALTVAAISNTAVIASPGVPGKAAPPKGGEVSKARCIAAI